MYGNDDDGNDNDDDDYDYNNYNDNNDYSSLLKHSGKTSVNISSFVCTWLFAFFLAGKCICTIWQTNFSTLCSYKITQYIMSILKYGVKLNSR